LHIQEVCFHIRTIHRWHQESESGTKVDVDHPDIHSMADFSQPCHIKLAPTARSVGKRLSQEMQFLLSHVESYVVTEGKRSRSLLTSHHTQHFSSCICYRRAEPMIFFLIRTYFIIFQPPVSLLRFSSQTFHLSPHLFH